MERARKDNTENVRIEGIDKFPCINFLPDDFFRRWSLKSESSCGPWLILIVLDCCSWLAAIPQTSVSNRNQWIRIQGTLPNLYFSIYRDCQGDNFLHPLWALLDNDLWIEFCFTNKIFGNLLLLFTSMTLQFNTCPLLFACHIKDEKYTDDECEERGEETMNR